MRKECSLEEIEEIVCEAELVDVGWDIAETWEETQLIISGWWVEIEELGIRLHDGLLCNFDKEEQCFMPDISVTVIYEAEAENADYIYFEQDGMETTLYNWRGGRMSPGQIENLKAVLVVPERDGE